MCIRPHTSGPPWSLGPSKGIKQKPRSTRVPTYEGLALCRFHRPCVKLPLYVYDFGAALPS